MMMESCAVFRRWKVYTVFFFFFFQAEDGIRDVAVTGVQTCALPISKEARDLAVYPDLGIIVERGLKDDRRTRRIEAADLLGNRNADPVPVKGEASVASAGR